MVLLYMSIKHNTTEPAAELVKRVILIFIITSAKNQAFIFNSPKMIIKQVKRLLHRFLQMLRNYKYKKHYVN